MPSSDPQTHPLESFVRLTFGDQFGKVLLAGYGRDAGRREIRLRLSVIDKGKRIQGRILDLSGDLPHGREPLVLAALVKLLLSREPLSAELEFGMPAVLGILGWPNVPGARGEVDTIIRKYLGLSYGVRREVGGGLYAFIIGYDREDGIELEGEVITRNSLRVHFHPSFVEALKESRVAFAGIDFGRLRLYPG